MESKFKEDEIRLRISNFIDFAIKEDGEIEVFLVEFE